MNTWRGNTLIFGYMARRISSILSVFNCRLISYCRQLNSALAYWKETKFSRTCGKVESQPGFHP